MYAGNHIVEPSDLMDIPVGSIILVGDRLDNVYVTSEEEYIDRYISIAADPEVVFYASCLECTWEKVGERLEYDVFVHAAEHVKKEKEASIYNRKDSSVWFVFSPGKAVLVNSHYPEGETEDLDWFKPWQVTVIGFNSDYAKM